MLESLKKVGLEVGKELNRAWENLADGWRELLSRSGSSLTHFVTRKGAEAAGTGETPVPFGNFPSWSLLAGEVVETDNALAVRLELPGMDKQDCEISIEGNMLVIRGEKRYERESLDERYHLLERAYGTFQRAVPLPRNVDVDRAEANYKNGVLTVRLPKTEAGTAKRIIVN